MNGASNMKVRFLKVKRMELGNGFQGKFRCDLEDVKYIKF